MQLSAPGHGADAAAEPASAERRRFMGMAAAGMLAAVPVPLPKPISITVPLAPAALPMEGKVLLIYELRMANDTGAPFSPASLTAGDGKARELARFAGGELASRTAILVPESARATVKPTVIEHGQTGIVYVEFELAPDAVPGMLAHKVEMLSSAAPGDILVPPVRVDTAPIANLGAPLAGGPWVAIHSPVWPRGHRRMVYTVDGAERIPGRYAIDFVGTDAGGRTHRGDPERPADTLGYGAAVLAVADAVVAAARDDMQEAATVSANGRHALADATGNYIALQLVDGRVVFYEHLKPGSVTVRAGQRVKAGQVIGALGFTGDSTGPHLHFSVASANSALGAEGLPFTIKEFELLGHYGDLGQLGKAAWEPLAKGMSARRKREWPGWNAVVRFPG